MIFIIDLLNAEIHPIQTAQDKGWYSVFFSRTKGEKIETRDAQNFPKKYGKF